MAICYQSEADDYNDISAVQERKEKKKKTTQSQAIQLSLIKFNSLEAEDFQDYSKSIEQIPTQHSQKLACRTWIFQVLNRQ